jgi:hypothetical protein
MEGLEGLLQMLVSDRAPVLTARPDFLLLVGKTSPRQPRQEGMTAFSTSHASPCRASGLPADVIDWRRCRLAEAGFPLVLATVLAGRRDVDLHELLQLVDRGCRPELAARILAPLEPTG